MANGENAIRAGVDSYLNYKEELVFGTFPATGSFLNFGDLTGFTPSITKNLFKRKGMNGVLPTTNATPTARDNQSLLPGTFDGSLSINMRPFDFTFMKYFFGTVSGAGTAASVFNYPQATASTDADKRNYLKVPSFSMSSNMRFDGTGDNVDQAYNYTGSILDSVSITGNIGEPIKVALTVPISKVAINTTLEEPAALPSSEVYHFTGSSLELPTGSAVSNIFETFTLSMKNGSEKKWGLGDEFVKRIYIKSRDFNLNVTLTKEGREFFDDFLGDTLIGSVTLKLSGDTNHETEIILVGCKFDNPDEGQNYSEIVTETFDIIPKVVYMTEQQTA